MVVAFFGHADAPSDTYPMLERKVMDLSEQNENITFLVGTNGSFDCMARQALKQALKRFPHIKCYVVLAYYNPTDKESIEQYGLPTLFPTDAPPRYAIDYRNNYMVNECDAVICYITHTWGGAWKFVHKAEKQGKTIINLAKQDI